MTLKIPPPMLFLGCLILIWLLPKTEVPISLLGRNIITGILTIIGIIIAGFSLYGFYQAKTTINPQKPEKTSKLVTSGIFRFSRNPMYLSLVIWLSAWTLLIATLWGIVVIIGFVFYLTECQIKPEEHCLSEKFGEQFKQYQQRVRRWI